MGKCSRRGAQPRVYTREGGAEWRTHSRLLTNGYGTLNLRESMVYSLEIGDRAGPQWSGLFYLEEVSRLLGATNVKFGGEYEVAFNWQTVSGWSRHGFFPLNTNEFERNKRFTSFGGVVTSRMIALLLSHGVKIGRIAKAHNYLKVATSQAFPFVSRKFWVESPDVSRQVYSELDKMIVTASQFGQLTFTDLLHGPLDGPSDMEFDDSHRQYAQSWTPVEGVTIDPQIKSGQPCVSGTRTPTSVLRSCYAAGDQEGVIADGYCLTIDQVRSALAWEESLAGT